MMRIIHALKAHWALFVVLVIYVSLATAHSLIVPLTRGDDEWAHFLYIRFISEHGRLPVNLAERSNRAEAGYKADDPPLYHLLISAATSGLEPTRLLRPIDSPRRELAENFVYPFEFIVHTGPEIYPFRGEVLLGHLARAGSIVFGAVLIGVTYVTSLALWPSRRRALTTAALLAFLPAFIFHSSMISYDSLSAALTALFLLVGIKAIKQPQRWRWWLALGVLAGLAITTKYSAVLLPLEIVFIAWLAFQALPRPARDLPAAEAADRASLPLSRSRGWPTLRFWFVRILAAGLAMVLAASWWFGFVLWHFNTVSTQGWLVGILEPVLVRGAADSTAVNISAWLLGKENLSTDGTFLIRERDYSDLARTSLDSFWAAPIAGKFILSPWLPLLFSLAGLVGLAGLVRVWRRAGPMNRVWLALLLFHTLLIVPLLATRLFLSADPVEVAQGRHILMPAGSAVAILLVWGWEQWQHRLSQVVVVGLLLWSVFGQLVWAAATYPPPLPVWVEEPPGDAAAQLKPIDQTLVEGLQLTGVTWPAKPDAPALELTLWWESLASLAEDYLIELTLLDAADQVVSYTVGHPVQGRYPTRAWEPGDVIKDTHWLPLSGLLNGDYRLQLRLLTRSAQPAVTDQTVSLGTVPLAVSAGHSDPCAVWFQGQARTGGLLDRTYPLRSTITVVGADRPALKPLSEQSSQAEQTPFISVDNFHIFVVGPEWAETYRLVAGSTPCRTISFDLPARDFTLPEIPSPLAAEFNGEIRLLGYDMPTRRIQPGGRLPLTLYWQALTYSGQDYRIFDNLLDREQQRWGGYDRRARDGYSTLLWVPGEVITDAFGVPVDPATPDGVYTLDIGLYREAASGAESLPIVADGQPTGSSGLRLGPIKVGGPPADVTVSAPRPQMMLRQPIGDEIVLLGYDLNDQNGRPLPDTDGSPAVIPGGQNLVLTLYWQVLDRPQADYTTFLHLRNSANETEAQKDSPPHLLVGCG
jgi:hypothetical protein